VNAFPVAKAGKLRVWGPAVLWAAFILAMSTGAMSGGSTGALLATVFAALGLELEPPILETIHVAIRKSAHVTEYLVFALMLDRGFSAGVGHRRGVSWAPLVMAVTLSLIDETHQALVPSRTGSIVDCGFDAVGAAVGVLVAERFGNPVRLRSC
jgi:VanZ family protein